MAEGAAGAVRAVVKTFAEFVVASAARLSLRAGGLGDRTAILAFHNVVGDQADTREVDGSLHLPISRFVEMVDAVASLPNTDVVPLAQALSTTVSGFRVVFTFDDAYRGAIRLALPVLQARNFPCTIFVSPGLLGAETLWWDDVHAHAVAHGLSWNAQRTLLLAPPTSGLAERIPKSIRRAAHAADADFGIASAEELRVACRTGHVRLGCHTWSHACLPSLSDACCQDELARSQRWLEGSGLPWDPVHAFPYGRSCDRDVVALRTQGYSRAVLVEGGAFRGTGDGFCAPRLNVPAGMTAQGLVARLTRMGT